MDVKLDVSLDHPAHATHLFHMRLALSEAQKCIPSKTAFSVGAILVDPSRTPYRVLATGYSRELPGNTHAEQVCIEKFQHLLQEQSSPPTPESGYFLYTTMEPCIERLSGNQPCTSRLIDFGKVSTVYVGSAEPSTFIENNTASTKLLEKGIKYIIVPGMEQECLQAAIAGHSES